jgi:hypothetical protein
MSLSDDLSLLIGSYGIVSVHKALQKRMKEDYEYLKTMFEEKKEKKEVIVPDNKEVVLTEDDSEEVVVEKKEVKEEKKYRDPKEMKIWQKEQEEKKKKENEEKGINIKDLLTKENMKKWIEEEGRTYSYIAREYVGCKDSEVSATAKLFGIENTRKNVLIKNGVKK